MLELLSVPKNSLQGRYKVHSSRAGAPFNINTFNLELPNNTIVNVSKNLDELRTLSSIELNEKQLSFIPATLSSTQRICTVVDRGVNTGTQERINCSSFLRVIVINCCLESPGIRPKQMKPPFQVPPPCP